MTTIQSPYQTSDCIPQCLPRDDALLVQDTRNLLTCESETPRAPSVHRARTHVSNFAVPATDSGSGRLLTTGGVVLLNAGDAAGKTRTVTLPEASFANVGTNYKILVQQESTEGYKIVVNNVKTLANGGDVLIGGVMLGTVADAAASWSNGGLLQPAAASNTITLKKGTTAHTGGLNGSAITLTLVEAHKWLISGTVITGDVSGNNGSALFLQST